MPRIPLDRRSWPRVSASNRGQCEVSSVLRGFIRRSGIDVDRFDYMVRDCYHVLSFVRSWI